MLKKYLTGAGSKTRIVLVVTFLVLLISVGFNTCQYINKRNEDKQGAVINSVTNAGQAIIQNTTRDKHDRQIAKILEVPVANNEQKKQAVGVKYIDTVSQTLQVALKDIDELTKVNSTLVAKVKLYEKMLETTNGNGSVTYRQVKVHQDKYLFAHYDPESDSLHLNYNASITTVKYDKRNRVLGPKKQYIDIFSDDPRVTINGVKRFSTDVTQKPKKFSIGPNVSYSYNYYDRKFYPTIGIGLQYNLIRF